MPAVPTRTAVGGGSRLAKRRRKAGPPARMISVCSWCRRVRAADRRWVEAPRALRWLPWQRITHGLCPDCRQAYFPRGSRAA